jgi:hypothetical protein
MENVEKVVLGIHFLMIKIEKIMICLSYIIVLNSNIYIFSFSNKFDLNIPIRTIIKKLILDLFIYKLI